MLRDFINIIGVNSASEFPVLTPLDRYRQFTVEEALVIPIEKPDVEQITSVMIEAKVTDFRTIATPTGLKIIVDGILNQKVVYTADEPTQSIHSAHFVKNFCTFIEVPLVIAAGSNSMTILQGLGITLDDVVVGEPHVIIEDLSVKLVDARNIKKCAILFAWATLNTLLTPFLPPV